MKRLYLILVITSAALLLAGCSKDSPSNPSIEEKVEEELSKLSLKEKVCQMFFVRPEAMNLNTDVVDGGQMVKDKLSRVNDDIRKFCKEYPVGGICLFAHNIIDPQQLPQFTSELHSLPLRPLLCVDEEGGRVARIANNDSFGLKRYESMGAIGSTGNSDNAFEAGSYIGSYVKRYGFDIDFAPVADVNTNPENIVIGARAFSDDPYIASSMVTRFLDGLWGRGVYGCVKHFPGHGDVKGDTHTGYVATQKTWEDMLECEIISFRSAIHHGVQVIMAAHIATPNITGNDLPSTMSKVILTDKLRGELGFNGLIITDAMEMGAITQHYTSAQSAVGTVKAGSDIVLMPQNLREAIDAVIAAVESKEIPESRIDESVRRILTIKHCVSNSQPLHPF